MNIKYNKKLLYFLLTIVIIISIICYFGNLESFTEEPAKPAETKDYCRDMNSIENINRCWNGEKLQNITEMNNGEKSGYNFQCCGNPDILTPTKWICNKNYNDIRSIRRNSKGEVECLSPTGNRECTIHDNMKNCIKYNNEINKSKSRELGTFACGKDYVKEYQGANIDGGYGGQGWCTGGYLQLSSLY